MPGKSPLKAKQRSETLFTSGDIAILSHAVAMQPDVELACFATKLAKKHLKFPLKGYADLAPLLEIGSLPTTIKRRGLRKGHLRKFFPKAFFPIVDAQDFLGKVLGACCWGAAVHHHEQFLKQPQRFGRIGYRKVG